MILCVGTEAINVETSTILYEGIIECTSESNIKEHSERGKERDREAQTS